MSVADRIAAPPYHAARLLMGAAARVYFRRIEVLHPDRVPARGPLLVVANHPASFTDVILLSRAIPRRLHFLAMAPIFKPWFRGLGLRLCGTLPVYRREDDPGMMTRNEDTFRACHEILDAGGAVLIFPEGTSRTDRSIVKVKTGAARLALAQDSRPSRTGALTVLPVGLHFSDRTRFQTNVALSVGDPIDLAPDLELARTDGPAAVRALTERIQFALETLILNVPEADRVALVAAVERLYRDEVRQHTDGMPDVEIARGIAEHVEWFTRTDPARIARAWSRIRGYERKLEALHVEDSAVRELTPDRSGPLVSLRLVALGLAGALPALAGALVHYLPYRLSGEAGLLAPAPTHIAGMRMTAAVVLFPATYALVGYALWRGLGWPPRAVAVALGLLAVAGLHALAYFRWLAHQRQRIRLLLFKVSSPRRLARLRAERRDLIALFERSRLEHAAERAAGRAGP
jgi:glycerol-3-phosphate O-acyltransferase / dihydroxyacetone phosphate acyltransferase